MHSCSSSVLAVIGWDSPLTPADPPDPYYCHSDGYTPCRRHTHAHTHRFVLFSCVGKHTGEKLKEQKWSEFPRCVIIASLSLSFTHTIYGIEDLRICSIRAENLLNNGCSHLKTMLGTRAAINMFYISKSRPEISLSMSNTHKCDDLWWSTAASSELHTHQHTPDDLWWNTAASSELQTHTHAHTHLMTCDEAPQLPLNYTHRSDSLSLTHTHTQYVIIAYCFIMYYNTAVQIIGTICNK